MAADDKRGSEQRMVGLLDARIEEHWAGMKAIGSAGDFGKLFDAYNELSGLLKERRSHTNLPHRLEPNGGLSNAEGA